MFGDNDDYKLIAFIVAAVVILLLSLVFTFGFFQDYMMARRGLCFATIQMQNREPQHQWEKCK